MKVRFFFSVGLSRGITFLVRAVCFPSPDDADFAENRLRSRLKECLRARQGAGTTVQC